MAAPLATVHPYVTSFQEVLQEMEGSTAPGPEVVKAWAREALAEQGAGEDDAAVGFAHGSLGLLAGHTLAMEGYAVLMSLSFGVAVALRSAQGRTGHIRHTNDAAKWPWKPGEVDAAADAPLWVRIVQQTLRRSGVATTVDVVVATAMPPACIDARLATLGVATHRAVRAFSPGVGTLSGAALAQQVRSVLSTCTGVPYSSAYPLGVQAAAPPGLTLIDTRKSEHLPLPAPPPSEVRWGLLTLGADPIQPVDHHVQQQARAVDALRALNRTHIGPLTSFSELEHRHLDQALGLLAPVHQPVVRHLVGENRRVSRFVRAVQTRDWQLMGALLLMSHDSLRHDGNGTNDAVDFVVDRVADRATDGMFGACLTGRGPAVVMAGRPLALHRTLLDITTSLREELGLEASHLIL